MRPIETEGLPDNKRADAERLLVATADAELCRQITEAAAREGFFADGAADGISALKCARRNAYGLTVLDTGLPEVNGLLVCRELRKSSTAPIIMISGLSSEEDRLAGFMAGGNDYLVKPFFMRELMARIKSLISLWESEAGGSGMIVSGGICVDDASRCVYVDRHEIQLAPKEYDLLCFLCRHPHQAFSRDSLLDRVWGREFFGSDRTVDTHVKSLREKIRPYQDRIATVWGFGYRLEP